MSRPFRLSRSNGPPMLPAVHLGRPLTAVALLALAASTGCAGNTQTAPPTERGTSAVSATVRSTSSAAPAPSGTSSAPGTTTGSSPAGFTSDQQVVIQAYGDAMASYERAATASDPFEPTFKNSFTPDALRELQIRIQQRKENGLSVRDAQSSKASIVYVAVELSATGATLATCEVDDRVVYRTADSSVVNDKVSTSRWTVRVVAPDGVWKIENRQQEQTWDGEELDECLDAEHS